MIYQIDTKYNFIEDRFSSLEDASRKIKYLSKNTIQNAITLGHPIKTKRFLSEKQVLEEYGKGQIRAFNLVFKLNNFPMLNIRSTRENDIELRESLKNDILKDLNRLNGLLIYSYVMPKISIEGQQALEYCTGLWENEEFKQSERVRLIFNIVAKCFNISVTSYKLSTRRFNELVFPRMAAMWFLRKYTSMTLKNIGKLFPSGKDGLRFKDHSTVTHSIQRFQDIVDTDKYYASVFMEIKNLLDEEVAKINARILLS